MNAGAAASPHVGPAVSHVPDGCPLQNTTPGSGVTRTGQRGEGLAPGRPKNLGGQTSVWTQASDVQLCKETGWRIHPGGRKQGLRGQAMCHPLGRNHACSLLEGAPRAHPSLETAARLPGTRSEKKTKEDAATTWSCNRSAHEPLIHYEPRGRGIRQKYSASFISGGKKPGWVGVCVSCFHT